MSSHTKDQKSEYWKKRILKKIISVANQLIKYDFKDLKNMINHSGIETKKCNKIIEEIEQKINELYEVVDKSN